jgi:D-3-phosphoglycerate dehydrogenase / 2-oxoglutarate reductase
LSESKNPIENFHLYDWPVNLVDADFIIITCALTKSSYHLINRDIIESLKTGVRIINVARGPIIDQPVLEEFLKLEKIHSVALDVFEVEPLPNNSYLKTHPKCILGSHNASNTIDAVKITSESAIKKLNNFLVGNKN